MLTYGLHKPLFTVSRITVFSSGLFVTIKLAHTCSSLSCYLTTLFTQEKNNVKAEGQLQVEQQHRRGEIWNSGVPVTVRSRNINGSVDKEISFSLFIQ